MSFHMAEVGIIKIKPEFQTEFGYLYNGEYDKLQNPEMLEFVADYYSDDSYFYNDSIRELNHEDCKKEWIGKYKTSYEDGIFTFGHYYNYNNGAQRCYWIDLEYILDDIGVWEEREFWDEDEWYK